MDDQEGCNESDDSSSRDTSSTKPSPVARSHCDRTLRGE